MAVSVSRVLHAGYVFKSETAKILFDPIFFPIFSGNCHAFPEVQFDYQVLSNEKFDAVFISHFHEDHCSLKSLDLLDRSTKILLYCVHEELFAMIRALGFKEVLSLQIGEPVMIHDFTITSRLALDADVDSIFHIECQGFNFLNVVDSWIDPSTLRSLQKVENWDLILWPFQTMRELEVLMGSRCEPSDQRLPSEWMEDLLVLRPKHLVPSSCQFKFEPWSWYNNSFFPITYANFKKQIQRALPDTKVLRLDPARTLLFQRNGTQKLTPTYAENLSWLQMLPMAASHSFDSVGSFLDVVEQDYDYHPELTPPHTREIATHFLTLTEAQEEQVIHFCQQELTSKFRDLGSSEEENYFANPRRWRLSLYRHDQSELRFYYRVESENIEFLSMKSLELSKGETEENSAEAIEWLTEIPIAKLFGALYRGESLTSIYLRVNDAKFSALIEQELTQFDPLQDPLIRCLYTNVFASYQRYELDCLHGSS